ncbi:hypothetical protein ACP4OV_014034 [Aristida adscensionis]
MEMAGSAEMEVKGGSSSSSSASALRLQILWSPQRRNPVPAYSGGSVRNSSGTTLSSSGGSFLHSSGDGVAGEAGSGFCQDIRKIQDLVFEFSNGDARAVETWLLDLDVGWVLLLPDGDDVASEGRLRPLQHFARRCGRALTASTSSISFKALATYDMSNYGKPSVHIEDVGVLFARFLEATVLKMLPFLRVIRSAGSNEWAVPPNEKIQALIELAEVLEETREKADLLRKNSSLNPDADESIHKAMQVLDEAIWDTIDEIRIMSSRDTIGDDTTYLSVLTCVLVLTDKRTPLYRIVHKAYEAGDYVPRYYDTIPFTSLIMEMISYLEEKLSKKSQLVPDQSKGLLHLLGIIDLVWRELDGDSFVHLFPLTDLTRKVDDYIQKYLQVSWAPVLSCLHQPNPVFCLSLGRPSPLRKFESEFQKTYTTQKLWKVVDPNLRRKLREAIIKKVTSGFTEYLEDNNIANPRVTSEELKEMLQELFEG